MRGRWRREKCKVGKPGAGAPAATFWPAAAAEWVPDRIGVSEKKHSQSLSCDLDFRYGVNREGGKRKCK